MEFRFIFICVFHFDKILNILALNDNFEYVMAFHLKYIKKIHHKITNIVSSLSIAFVTL